MNELVEAKVLNFEELCSRELTDNDLVVLREMLLGNSLSDFHLSSSAIIRLSTKVEGLDSALIELAVKRGSKGRFVFISWLLASGLWKKEYAPTIIDCLSDCDIQVRASAIGVLSKRAIATLMDIVQFIWPNEQLEQESLNFFLGQTYAAAQLKYDIQNWDPDLTDEIRLVGALVLAGRILSGETLKDVMDTTPQEDVLLFEHLCHFSGVDRKN